MQRTVAVLFRLCGGADDLEVVGASATGKDARRALESCKATDEANRRKAVYEIAEPPWEPKLNGLTYH